MTIRGETDIPDSNFVPIPQLRRADGDVSVVFLSGNGVLFEDAMADDWYRATDAKSVLNIGPSDNASDVQSYIPAEAASPMGCVEQWQWCNAANPKDSDCGPLASLFDAFYGAAPVFNVTSDTLHKYRPSSPDATATRLLWPALMQTNNPSTLALVLYQLGAKSLSSQAQMFSGLQLTLPTNQWQLDVTRWWHIILASVQTLFVNTAVGPTDPKLQQELTIHPANDEERKLCNSQVRAPTHRQAESRLTHDRAEKTIPRDSLLMLK